MSFVISDSIVRARKRHFCDQCDRRIEPGQEYRRLVHNYEGFSVSKAHVDCDACAGELFDRLDRGHDEGIHLREDVSAEDRDWIVPIYPQVALRLWPGIIIPEERI